MQHPSNDNSRRPISYQHYGFPIPVIGFAAFSGTGKTTLLCQIIPLLTARSLRLGLIKHSHHRFEVDRPGKDSAVLAAAGAQQVVVASRNRQAVLTRYDDTSSRDLHGFVQRLNPTELDLLLVEGYKYAALPKIELHRPSLGHPLLALNDPDIIALACDAEFDCESPDCGSQLNIPILNLNDANAIADFIYHCYWLDKD